MKNTTIIKHLNSIPRESVTNVQHEALAWAIGAILLREKERTSGTHDPKPAAPCCGRRSRKAENEEAEAKREEALQAAVNRRYG